MHTCLKPFRFFTIALFYSSKKSGNFTNVYALQSTKMVQMYLEISIYLKKYTCSLTNIILVFEHVTKTQKPISRLGHNCITFGRYRFRTDLTSKALFGSCSWYYLILKNWQQNCLIRRIIWSHHNILLTIFSYFLSFLFSN